jgi:hypothetical protein
VTLPPETSTSSGINYHFIKRFARRILAFPKKLAAGLIRMETE